MSFKEVFELIEELKDDSSVPKNLKAKLESMKQMLGGEGEESLKIHKALNDLEEISDDVNIPTFVRTQLWNLAGMLESITSS